MGRFRTVALHRSPVLNADGAYPSCSKGFNRAEQEGEWISLDDALNTHEIGAGQPEWMETKVTGADMPVIGLELLTDRSSVGLRETIRRYAANDVAPLFELHAALQTVSSGSNYNGDP